MWRFCSNDGVREIGIKTGDKATYLHGPPIQAQWNIGSFTMERRSLGTRPSENSLGTRPSEIGRRVWEIGWGGSVHCARNAGALPIDS